MWWVGMKNSPIRSQLTKEFSFLEIWTVSGRKNQPVGRKWEQKTWKEASGKRVTKPNLLEEAWLMFECANLHIGSYIKCVVCSWWCCFGRVAGGVLSKAISGSVPVSCSASCMPWGEQLSIPHAFTAMMSFPNIHGQPTVDQLIWNQEQNKIHLV